jgi:ribosome biogenesis protein
MKIGYLPYHVKYKGELSKTSFRVQSPTNEPLGEKRYFLTASYDGHVRSFDYSQKLINSTQVHHAPITSFCVVSTPIESNADSVLLATSSHDLSAHLTKFTPSSSDFQSIASLHLHTAPLSSISASHTGTHLLTSSWDTLVGVWDTTIPTADEVPLNEINADRKKRRKVSDESEKAVRKAPVSVLKGHTARVSKVVFGKDETKVAYSCGFDSTVRMWDVENGFCTNTIVSVCS